MSSFKSSENIQKKEGGPDRSVSDNQSSSVTLNEVKRAVEVTSVVPVLVPVTFAVKSSRSPYLDNQKAFILGP